ncbi:MAG: hypothetical protein WD159_00820, partial [Patescibacteria group bacterium]
MEGHMGKDKIQLLNQALNAAASSLNLAKQLLSEIEFHPAGPAETPGLVGKYDGMFMVTEAGKKYPVPDNYSAKTKLVYDDKLKMIEGPEGRRFKLLEEVEREEQEAQLAVKDGHFEALGKDGSYRLIQGAVRYWGGQEGDKLKILLPKGNRNVPFAGLTEIIGRKPGEGAVEEPKPQPAPKPEPKPVEKPIEKVEKKEEPAKPPKTESKPAEKAPAKKEAPKPTPKLTEAKPASKLSE